MQRRSHIQLSSLIVFLSILTIVIQFMTYYLFASVYLILGVSCLISIICSHILLEQSLTYETSFIYTILTLFISIIITVLTYFSKENSFLPYSGVLVGIVAVNWFIPTFQSFFRHMFDYGTRLEDYPPYHRNSSIIFLIFYFGIFAYGLFTQASFTWMLHTNAQGFNYTPFNALSAMIEDYLYHFTTLGAIFAYLASRILIYIPFGFYCILLLRRRPRLLRLFALFIFPVLIEVLQYFSMPSRSDIDDVIYGFIGSLIGALLFHLINTIFRTINGKDFLSRSSDFRYSNSSLHF